MMPAISSLGSVRDARLTKRIVDFFELVGNHVPTMVSNARAYEEERKRAEALAELDQAKTVFFSNVSHEFRTPLTFMLGPVEELLAKSNTVQRAIGRALK